MAVVPTHVALLRGINVGGNNKIAMADLRNVVASLGHTDVSTYIQSGNVLFTPRDEAEGGPQARSGSLAAGLEAAITGAFGVQPAVVVISRDELAQAVRDNPYPAEPNPKCVHVIFFGEPLSPEIRSQVAEAERQAADKGGRDQAAAAGRALFLHTPDGYGRSELAARLTRLASGATAGTARNWSTVTKLLALCGAPPAR